MSRWIFNVQYVEEEEEKKNGENNEECWSSICNDMRNMIVSARTNQTQMIMGDGHNSQRK